jgi:TRAP-type C4-dicarboxylate transport system permease small subunit
MAGLDKFRQLNDKLSTVAEWVGMVAFVSMMLLTNVDVIGAKIFLKPVPGSLDLMMLAQLVCISFALSASFIANRHVAVEFFIPLMPRFLQKATAFCIDLLMVILFIVMTWQLFVYGHGLKVYGELSPTVRIHLYPFVYGASLAFLPACLAALANFIESATKVFAHES